MDRFVLHSDFKPMGDQPQAIEALTKGFEEGNQFETLVGVTGSGKTFTMANIIQNVQKPTLIISHNKTLAAQLYGEMKEFFPENAVEYFVSYYDYYQPEAYVPQSDTYIAKDSSINDEIDKLRHSATAALSERNDVIIVASVSCIYGLGAPVDYKNMVISLRPGMEKDRDDCIRKLIDIQYVRNDQDFKRGTFRVRGDVVEVYPSSSSGDAIRVEFFGDEVDRISEIDSLTGEVKGILEHIAIFPNSHYVVEKEKMDVAIENIRAELAERVKYFKSEDKLLEAQRIEERTNFDIEMMQETGFCSGIENYSRHLAGLPAGCPPYTLMDYFPDDFLNILSGIRLLNLNNLLRRSLGNNSSAAVAPLWSHIYNIICCLNNIKIMFNNNYSVATLCKPVKDIDKLVDIGKMQTGCRLIKNIYSLSCASS
jgi:excinuclease ABC subunit B